MTLVREDTHGVYVIVNGSIHRPVPSRVRHSGVLVTHDGPMFLDGVLTKVGGTRFVKGDKPKVKNVNYTPYSIVGENELWTTHGYAFLRDGTGRHADSNMAWMHGQEYGIEYSAPPWLVLPGGVEIGKEEE